MRPHFSIAITWPSALLHPPPSSSSPSPPAAAKRLPKPLTLILTPINATTPAITTTATVARASAPNTPLLPVSLSTAAAAAAASRAARSAPALPPSRTKSLFLTPRLVCRHSQSRPSKPFGTRSTRYHNQQRRTYSSSAGSTSTSLASSSTMSPSSTPPSTSSPSSHPQISPLPPSPPILFSTWDVSSHVFLTTPHTYAIVNLKPLSPGHVLVCPLRVRKRLTDLPTPELADLFAVVQVIQRMLARKYFPPSTSSLSSLNTNSISGSNLTSNSPPLPPGPEAGSFNIAVQDGAGAGQTVPHVHVHVIPRIPNVSEKEGDGPTDEIYDKMASEEGNIGGALWDQSHPPAMDDPRPVPGGMFDRIEDSTRKARPLEDMEREAEEYRQELVAMGY